MNPTLPPTSEDPHPRGPTALHAHWTCLILILLSLILRRQYGSQVLPCQEARFSPSDNDIVEKADDEARQQKTESAHR